MYVCICVCMCVCVCVCMYVCMYVCTSSSLLPPFRMRGVGYKVNASASQAHKSEHLSQGKDFSYTSSRISPLFKKPVSAIRPCLNLGLQPNVNQVTYICAEQVVGFTDHYYFAYGGGGKGSLEIFEIKFLQGL